MLLVGLTGGIASGKTTVANLLAERGAVVIDTDEIAREVVEPGSAVWSKIVEHFGSAVLGPDKRINRERLAEIVFADPTKRALLNELTHPEIMRIMAERLEVLAPTDAVVVCVVPLLVETGSASMFNVVIAVTASEDEQVARLARDRGMSREDAALRIAAQAPPAERISVADIVIENDAGVDALSSRIDEVWQSLLTRRSA